MNPFEIIFYQPILNLLVWLHNVIPGSDFGWAIIGLTVVIKLILLPLSAKSLRSQKDLQNLQPKVKAVQDKHKDNKEQLSRELMALYKKEKVNPFSSCLPLLVQLPFLFAIFQVLRDGLGNGALDKLYPFVAQPGAIDMMFLGVVNLSERSITLALIAGALQFFQTRMLTHNKQAPVAGSQDENIASIMNKQMLYFMPIVTVFIGISFPGGLALYWAANTLISWLQQIYVFKTLNTKI